MEIKELSQVIINQIAAGEVVSRAFSVVKELVENSIDAGASQIDIIIANGGNNLIMVHDNGCGISKDQLSLAIRNHATSKLCADDICNIQFFGFRGEALASIASISRMKIESYNGDGQHGWMIEVCGGNEKPISPSAASKIGTKIEVRDLFYAVPARLKFLKSERTENSYIIDIVKKIALSSPSSGFSLKIDNRNILNYKQNQTQQERVVEVLGEEFIKNSFEIKRDDSIKILGYCSLASYNRSTSADQYFFVNRRIVKDRVLQSALKFAYQNVIADNRLPIAVIFIEVDPNEIDVNVHPTKSEIRFLDSGLIRSALLEVIKSNINQEKRTSTAISDGLLDNFDIFPGSKKHGYQPNFQHSVNLTPRAYNAQEAPQEFTYNAPTSEKMMQNHNENLLGLAMCQLSNKYIISQTNDCVIITDQHAAHERIVNEKMKQDYQACSAKSQRLLLPEIVELDDSRIEKFLQLQLEFAKIGLVFEKFGNIGIKVTGIPVIIAHSDLREIMMDIAADLENYDAQISLTDLIYNIIGDIACHNSVRAGQAMTLAQMNELLRQMESTQNAAQCNHGRPTYIKLNFKDLDTLFERT